MALPGLKRIALRSIAPSIHPRATGVAFISHFVIQAIELYNCILFFNGIFFKLALMRHYMHFSRRGTMATVMEIHGYRIILLLVSPSTVQRLLCRTQPALIFNLHTSLLRTSHYLTPSRMTLTLTSATRSTSTPSTSPRHPISNSRGLAVKTRT